ETTMFPPRIGEFLFPDGAVQSMWSWIRYRLQVRKGPFIETLPIKFAIIDDLALPWTHANFCMVQRSVSDQDLDVWVRIPTQHRFQRSYLQDMGERILGLFEAKIPDCQAKILNMPQDYLYEYSELGPPRFPVFSEKELAKLAR